MGVGIDLYTVSRGPSSFWCTSSVALLATSGASARATHGHDPFVTSITTFVLDAATQQMPLFQQTVR